LLLAFAGSAQATGVKPKIVNGTNADITDFPFQAFVFDGSPDPRDTSYFCGGVILDERHVLTAAHCLYDVLHVNRATDPADVAVWVGSADLGDPTDAVTATAEKVSFDPRYDPDTNDYDVGLITLPSDLFTGSETNIKPIGFVNSTQFDTALTGHSTLTVTGWGETESIPEFPDVLQKADVPAIDHDTCVADYAGRADITDRMFCAGDGPDPITDSCQGDSGGPIVLDTDPSPSVVTYKLMGLVDSGIGCADAGNPGIYTKTIQGGDFDSFIASDPPQAPLLSASTTITGTPLPGQTLTCNPGSWSDAPAFQFQFLRLAGSSSPVLASGQTYTVRESDRGTRIFCEVKASNAGGYGFADSASALVPFPAPPPPPPPPLVDATAPKLKVLKKSCTKTSCTVRIKVTDAQPSSGLAPVKATLRWKQKVACPRRSKASAARTCFKTRKRVLRAKAGKNGVFTITAGKLKPGTGYTITLVASDKAGNKPTFSTITSVRTKPARRHRL
jgi:secreted trypsin-like serine protease